MESIPTNTLTGLKAALKNGTAQKNFPIEHEIPDVWNGQDAPWIVGHYGEGYGISQQGVYLFRKYANPINRNWNQFNTNDYANTAVQRYLQNDYLFLCSAEIRSLMTTVTVPNSDGSQLFSTITTNIFLMSRTEVYGSGFKGDGVVWDAWKQRSQWSSPNNAEDPGRVIRTNDGTAVPCWLRNPNYSGTAASDINATGALSQHGVTTLMAVLPACFISAD